MKILLTGSTGFIGQWVGRALAGIGHQVVPFRGDLRNPDSFPEGSFDRVIHLAAIVDKAKWKVADLWSVNVEGTRRLLERYDKCPMLFLSSTDVEKDSLTPYGESKAAAEEAVMRIPGHVAIRAPSVFGPGDTHYKLIPRCFRHFLGHGETLVINQGEVEHIYVSWLADEIQEALNLSGLLRANGYIIENSRLAALIEAVCLNAPCSNPSDGDRRMLTALNECKNFYETSNHVSIP